jgi:DNA invertase Pin-like site-specific DNA recombinase
LVSRFDRISRNLADYYRYKNAFEGHGVSIKSVTETIGDSHSGEFMEALYVLTAQLDSHHRSERVKAGSRRKTEKA